MSFWAKKRAFTVPTVRATFPKFFEISNWIVKVALGCVKDAFRFLKISLAFTCTVYRRGQILCFSYELRWTAEMLIKQNCYVSMRLYIRLGIYSSYITNEMNIYSSLIVELGAKPSLVKPQDVWIWILSRSRRNSLTIYHSKLDELGPGTFATSRRIYLEHA